MQATPKESNVRKRNEGRRAAPANRRALIAAAREVFAESGYQAPFSSIARRAGVGQGSLYRHFPDRLALAVAVFDENLGELEELASRPDATLDELLALIAEQATASAALVDALTSEKHDPRVEQLGSRVSAVAETVLQRQQAAGRVAGHVTIDDVMLAISMLASVLSSMDPDQRPAIALRARRVFAAAFGVYRPGAADGHG